MVAPRCPSIHDGGASLPQAIEPPGTSTGTGGGAARSPPQASAPATMIATGRSGRLLHPQSHVRELLAPRPATLLVRTCLPGQVRTPGVGGCWPQAEISRGGGPGGEGAHTKSGTSPQPPRSVPWPQVQHGRPQYLPHGITSEALLRQPPPSAHSHEVPPAPEACCAPPVRHPRALQVSSCRRPELWILRPAMILRRLCQGAPAALGLVAQGSAAGRPLPLGNRTLLPPGCGS